MAALIAQERAAAAVRVPEDAVVSDFARRAATRRSAPIACRRDAPLAPLTTFKVGGPADWLIETRDGDEIVAALSSSRTRTACR